MDNLRELLSEKHGELMFYPEFDKAIVGIVDRFGQPPIVCYSKNICIDILIQGGMTEEGDAEEYFEFNVIGGWNGELTPCFIETI